MDTIFAQATASGKAGVAIVRVSGPLAFEAARGLAGNLPPPRTVRLRTLRDSDGQAIDSALVICFEQDASFTGEQVVEFHLHGSIAVVRKLEAVLGRIEGLRLAAPGEFTRRSLENARLDLAQVEGLGDLIDAETEEQRQLAQRVLAGELSEKVAGWRRALVDAAALLEATIDFAEEEVPVDVMPDVAALLSAVENELYSQIKGLEYSERIVDGFEVAIVGPPNIGKSTLLNAIAKRPAALTSEIAGTTRDVIEVRIDLRGLPVTFLDTAGLRDTDDPLEAAGVDLARRRAERADLRIYLGEAGPSGEKFAAEIILIGKGDLPGREGGISGLTGAGVKDLLRTVWERLRSRSPAPSLITRERHRVAITTALEGLCIVHQMRQDQPELVAQRIREVSTNLGSLIGRIDSEDVLDSIFSKFCIGK